MKPSAKILLKTGRRHITLGRPAQSLSHCICAIIIIVISNIIVTYSFFRFSPCYRHTLIGQIKTKQCTCLLASVKTLLVTYVPKIRRTMLHVFSITDFALECKVFLPLPSYSGSLLGFWVSFLCPYEKVQILLTYPSYYASPAKPSALALNLRY